MARSARSTTIWARALTLRERLGGAPPPRNRAVAEQRLARWRDQAPFADSDLFHRRLALDHLTESDLLALLGESTTRLAQRVPQATSWAAELVSALAPHGHPSDLLAAIEPLIARHLSRLRAGAQLIADTTLEAPFDPDGVTQLIRPLLTGRVLPLLSSRLALDPPRGALELCCAYPVLARQVVNWFDQCIDVSLEFLARLAADADRVHTTFSTTRDLGRLVGIDGGLSYPHRGGRGVLIARFSSGTRVVYKPKSLAVDRHFQHLLQWVNGRGLEPPHWTLALLDRGDYGWAELVEQQDCASRTEVERFFARQGSLLALLHILGASASPDADVIAVGEHPILIDLESLFWPASIPPNSEAQRLPAASDRRIHRPTLDGQAVDVLDYVQPMLDGFSATYRLVLERRAELLADGGPLDRFATDEVRVRLRPASTYVHLLAESFRPHLLRNALERDRYFDSLWTAVPSQPGLARAVPHEQADLLRGDIPKFVGRPNSRDLWSTSGEGLADFFAESGLDVARRRVRLMSEADLAHHAWFRAPRVRSLR